MRRTLIKLIDNSFIIFVLFLFIFLWCRFFFNFALAFILSLILTLVFSLLIIYFKDKKANNILLTDLEQNKINTLKDYMLFNSEEKVKKLFTDKIQAKFLNRNIFNVGEDFFYLHYEKILTAEDVIKILKETKLTKISIVCIEVDKETEDLIKKIENYSIKLIKPKNLLLDFQLSVDNIENEIKISKSKKYSFKEFFKLFVREENAKGYLISAIILMLSTLIIKQKIYYYIFVSILLVLSFICKFLPKFIKVKK